MQKMQKMFEKSYFFEKNGLNTEGYKKIKFSKKLKKISFKVSYLIFFSIF